MNSYLNAKLEYLIIGFIFFLSIQLTFATLAKDDKKKTSGKKEKVKLSTESVLKRGLVSEAIKATDVVKEHNSYCDVEREVKNFEADTLAYVTPWNNHGYDVAKLFAHKFTYVSPVWLQVQRRSSGYNILGTHDIDHGWMEEVSKGGKVKIVPRILFDHWSPSDYNALFTSEHEQNLCSRTIIEFLQRNYFDGVVLEVWSQVAHTARKSLVHFIVHLGEDFFDAQLSFILVLAPPLVHDNVDGGVITQSEFETFAPFVTAFSLMTYDYSNPHRPGPNSPLDWVKSNVEKLVPDPLSPNRRKILLGLNFYGNDYSFSNGGPILGNQYVQLLTKHKPKLKWDSKSSEHMFKYKGVDGEHTVYYPTLLSIDRRLQLARQLGTGVSIWEIGQGLDYFYDLL